MRELGVDPRAEASGHHAHEGLQGLVLGQRRRLRLHGRLTLRIKDRLLLLLLEGTSAAQSLNASQLARLGLLPEAA